MPHSWKCSIKTNCGDYLDDKELDQLSSRWGLPTFSIKDQKVTILGFADHTISVPTTQVSSSRAKTAKGTIQMSECQ